MSTSTTWLTTVPFLMLNFNHFSPRSPIILSTERETRLSFQLHKKKSIKSWTWAAPFPFHPSVSTVTSVQLHRASSHHCGNHNCDSAAMETIPFSLLKFPACWGKACGHNWAEQTAPGCHLHSGDCCVLLPVSGQCQENRSPRRLDPGKLQAL